MSETKYCKDSILKSKKFIRQRDVLMVVLDDDHEYTIDEVNELYKNFIEREVK